MQKGALRFEKKGREYLYYPVLEEAECKRRERQSFVQRVYKDATQPMIAAFLQDTELTKDEIDALEHILEKKRKGKHDCKLF